LRFKFEPRDAWVGVYWNFNPYFDYTYGTLDVHLCILPFVPLRLTIWRQSWCRIPTAQAED
jgi:hypothetical protein